MGSQASKIAVSQAQFDALWLAGIFDRDKAGSFFESDVDVPGVTALRAAFDGTCIHLFSREEAGQVHAALTELANAEDAIAEDKHHFDSDERKAARSACRSLTSLAGKVLRSKL